MNNFIRFSVKHPVSVIMFILGIVLASTIGASLIQLDFLPKMQERYLLISAEFSGISAEEMRKLVTIQIEDTVTSLNGIKNISSVTRDGLSLTTIELQWNTDPDIAVTECRELIDQCYQILPDGCSKPSVKTFDPSSEKTLSVVIIPTDGDLQYGRYIADTDIKSRLQRIEGVGNVSIKGGNNTEIHVILDKTKIESLKLSIDSVAQALSLSNFEYPAGTITDGRKELLFKTKGLFTSIDEINEAPITNSNDGIIRLKNIGTVKYGTEKQESFSMYNGKEVIIADITKKSDSSPLAISNAVTDECENLKRLYGKNFDFEIVFNQALELKDSIKQLVYSVISGLLITSIIVLIFLRKIKISLLISSIMPLTILFSLLILYATGRTLNILSISGIAVGIGMVIDPSIVAVENIFVKLKEKKSEDSIVKAVQEIKLSSIGSTLTTIVVFIPFFFLPGVLGLLFSDLAVAVISSISFSCLLSLIYIPAVCSIFLQKNTIKTGKEIKLYYFEKKYAKTLGTVLKTKFFIPFIIILCFLISFILIKNIKKEIIPATRGDYISAEILYTEGTHLDIIRKDAEELTDKLLKQEFISNISITGGIENSNYEELSRISSRKELLTIRLKTKDQNAAEKFLESVLKNSDIKLSIKKDNSTLEKVISLDSNKYIVVHDNINSLQSLIDSNRNIITSVTPESFIDDYVFEPDRTICARFGITSAQIAALARNTLEGVYSSSFYQNGREIPILIKYENTSINNPDSLKNTAVILSSTSIPLSALGNIKRIKSQKIFYRYNRKDANIIKTENIKNLPDELIQHGINISELEFSGIIQSVIILLIFVLILLYCVMGAQFESFLIPLLLLFAIPPAFTGAFAALKIFGKTININSLIALVVLFGTAVNNSILLYESIIESKKIDSQAIINSSIKKLRAIIITTLTSICALIPFAFDPSNRNSQVSMSIAIIGGLTVSLFVVLYLIPSVLFLVLRKKEK